MSHYAEPTDLTSGLCKPGSSDPDEHEGGIVPSKNDTIWICSNCRAPVEPPQDRKARLSKAQQRIVDSWIEELARTMLMSPSEIAEMREAYHVLHVAWN